MTSESRDTETMHVDGWSSVWFTVLYEYPFWVGVLEVEADGELCAVQHVFGVEPTSAEVAELGRREFVQLMDQAAGTPITADATQGGSRRASSPRRAARQAAQTTAVTGITTVAQDALRAQREEPRKKRQAGREAAAQHKRDAEKRKLREKHRGH